MSEQLPTPVQDAPAQHPIRLVVTDDLRRSRLTVFFRLLLFIPLALWGALWGIAVVFAVIAAWLAGLFTGRVPDGLHDFLATYTRFYTQISAYICIAANPYPSFTGRPGYPVDVEIAPTAPQSRATIFFRLLLAIPAIIVLNVLQYVVYVVAILAWFYALFTGGMNKGMRDLLAYCLRYQAQTYGYVLLLTRRYPSFSDE
jgi:small-conductance mechanosensitive channel